MLASGETDGSFLIQILAICLGLANKPLWLGLGKYHSLVKISKQCQEHQKYNTDITQFNYIT